MSTPLGWTEEVEETMSDELGPKIGSNAFSQKDAEVQHELGTPQSVYKIATRRTGEGVTITDCEGFEYGAVDDLDTAAEMLAAQIEELSNSTGETKEGVLQLVESEL